MKRVKNNPVVGCPLTPYTWDSETDKLFEEAMERVHKLREEGEFKWKEEVVGSWEIKPKFSFEYKGYTLKWNTAYELGYIVAKSGCGMPNPYEPMHNERDEFSEGYQAAKEEMKEGS